MNKGKDGAPMWSELRITGFWSNKLKLEKFNFYEFVNSELEEIALEMKILIMKWT